MNDCKVITAYVLDLMTRHRRGYLINLYPTLHLLEVSM